MNPDLVELDRDHPGFRDPTYRARRNAIARQALDYRPGDPLPRVAYTETETQVWATALQHLAPLHERRACRTFLDRWPSLGFTPDHIPEFEQVNRRLAATRFRLVPVAGLVSPRVFLSHLADGEFLATQYIRHHSTPLYTPEPDVIHELVGHAALLADPVVADLNRLFGDVTRVTDSDAGIAALIRVYWYGLEFGVVDSADGHRVVGAGLLSSYGELGRLETEPELSRFDIDVVAATPFDPTNYQGTLFVGDSEVGLYDKIRGWLVGQLR